MICLTCYLNHATDLLSLEIIKRITLLIQFFFIIISMCFYSQRLNQTFSYSKVVNIVTPQKYNDNCVMNINKQCLLFIEIVQLYILFILKSLISNNNKNEQQKKQYKELIIRVYTYTFFYQKVFFQKTLKLFLTVFFYFSRIF